MDNIRKGNAMFLLLFLCWVIFNQNFTLEIAIFGVVISAAIYLFACKFLDYSIKKDLFIMKKLPLIIQYVFILIWEVLKANVVIFKSFFTLTKEKREPVIVTFHTKLKSNTARTFLANAITLTPGTITMSLEDDKLTVHCFDKSLAKGLNDTIFERKLLKLEEGMEK